jgi:hypothetical protein
VDKRSYWQGLARCMIASAKHPSLWLTASKQAKALTPREWWRRWPPLPVPDSQWWRFRMETAYGDPNAIPSSQDVVSLLSWVKLSEMAERL